MNITYPFLVDFARPQRANELIVIQGDAKTRCPRFILMDDGKPLDVSEVDGIAIDAALPDQSHITAEAHLSLDEDGDPINEIVYQIPSSMTAAIGKTTLMITLYKVNEDDQTATQEVLHSFEFYVNTRNELYQDDSEEADAMAGLQDLIEKAEEAIRAVEQIVERTALPNPFPIRLIVDDETTTYDGSTMKEVNFGNLFERLDHIEESFRLGCNQIAAAISDNGVATSSDASPATMAANIGQIRSDGDLTAAKYVPSGKTWWANKTKYTGTGRDMGALSLSPQGANKLTSGAGYYDSIEVDGTAAYQAGMNAVRNNPNEYGLYTSTQYTNNRTAGQNDVKNDPNAYGLYSKAQYDANRITGRNDVINSPATYSLYTKTQYDANRTAGQNDVRNSPNDYNLYTKTQYDNNRTAGRNDVINSPGTYQLYTSAQYTANRTAGQNDVKNNPGTYGLYTQAQYNDYGASQYAAGQSATRTRTFLLSGNGAWDEGNGVYLGLASDLRLVVTVNGSGISMAFPSSDPKGSFHGTAQRSEGGQWVYPITQNLGLSIT